MQTSEQIDAIAAALAKAQAESDRHAESALVHALCYEKARPGRGHAYVPVVVRLMNRVVFGATDCWHYCGVRNQFGYGRLSVDGRTQVAHRLSYEVFVGPIPPGLLVLHRCDNPSCINPDHLWLGTYRDNSVDCWNKGRNPLRTYMETKLGGRLADIT